MKLAKLLILIFLVILSKSFTNACVYSYMNLECSGDKQCLCSPIYIMDDECHSNGKCVPTSPYIMYLECHRDGCLFTNLK